MKSVVLLMIGLHPAAGQIQPTVVDSLIMGLPVVEQIRTLHDYTVEMRQIDLALARLASDKALELSQDAGDDRLHARSLLNAGSLYLRTSVTDSAEIMYDKAGALFQAIEDSAGIADVKLNQGVLLLNLAQYNEALSMFRKALEYAAPLNDTLQIVKCRQNIAITHHYMGDFERAKNFYLEIIHGGYGDKYPEILLNTLANLGSLLEQFDEYTAAISYYNSALAIADSLENPYRKAGILINLGSSYIYTGRNQKALEVLMEAYFINEALGNKQGLAATLSHIGAVYELEGNFQRSNELYIQALQISEEIGDLRRVAIILAYMGENLMKQGYYHHALKYFRKSLQITTQHDLAAETAEIYKWMTFLHSITGNTDSANEYIEMFAEERKQLHFEMSYPESDTAIEGSSSDEMLPDKNSINTDIEFIIPFFALIIVSGLVIFIFLLMALLISKRQSGKKIYRRNRWF